MEAREGGGGAGDEATKMMASAKWKQEQWGAKTNLSVGNRLNMRKLTAKLNSTNQLLRVADAVG